MARPMAHLGPEGSSALCEGAIGVGHLAMTVTHEDAFDQQPLADSESRTLLTANLRLDNREELAGALSIAVDSLATMPDSALLLAAYRTWGTDCVDHLLGDFAFAIWDARTRRLMLARDHMGQRSLYYHRGEQFFAFASEIKGVWAAPDVPRAFCDEGLEEALARAWHTRKATRTKFDGIESLPGGTVMLVGVDGETTQKRYWEPRAAPMHLDRDEAYYREAYRSVLQEAVTCRLRRALRPCALLLSGGFDSAAIAGLAQFALGSRKLLAVSSVDDDDHAPSPRSARYWVELCAQGMAHLDVRYVLRRDRNIYSGLEQAFPATDGAVSPNQYVNSEIFQTVASAGGRVVMDGHGGDYSLNPRGGLALARLLATGRFRRFAYELAAHIRFNRKPLWQVVWRDVLAAFVPHRARAVINRLRGGPPVFIPVDPVKLDFARRVRPEGVSPLIDQPGRSLIHPRKNMLRALRRVQNHTTLGGILPSLYGLQFTQPFHDKRVVELALAIPEDLYFKDGRNRHLARTALADILPPEYQRRPSGNTPRIPDLLRMAKAQEPRMLADIERLQRNPRVSRYFDFARMRRMLIQPQRARPDRWTGSRVSIAMGGLLWALYFEWFLQENR